MSHTVRSSYFDGTLARDFFDVVAGDKLGAGIARHVYACQFDKSLVIKFEVATHSFQNMLEWEFWSQIKGTEIAKWFAPCVRISPCGTVLLQRRTQTIPATMKMPAKVPACIGDLKRENWGLLKGKVVCHDYGKPNNVFAGWSGIKKLKAAKWWSLKDATNHGGTGGYET